jgi:hypothetical protein
MSVNGFREEELVSRKVKVGNEWQTRVFPVVGGRLRILHETNERLGIQTETIKLDNDFVVVKAAIETQRGKFTGTGTASSQRDARLADSLVELAETRAIARALRFGGIGVEYTGAEEVSHVAGAEQEKEQTPIKEPEPLFREGNDNNKQEAKSTNGGTGKATQAQCRALFALSKRANYHNDDVAKMLAPFEVSRFEDLPREAASKLIGYMQQELAA